MFMRFLSFVPKIKNSLNQVRFFTKIKDIPIQKEIFQIDHRYLGFGTLSIGTLSTYLYFDNVEKSKHMDEYDTDGKLSVQRIKTTYQYAMGSLAIIGITTFTLHKSRFINAIIKNNRWENLYISIGTAIALLTKISMINYQDNYISKHLYWTGLNIVAGETLCIVGLICNPLVVPFTVNIFRACCSICCMTIGLTIAGICIDKKIVDNKDEIIGYGANFITGAGVLGFFLPSMMIGKMIYFGSIILFGSCAIIDTNSLIFESKRRNFDPINQSLCVECDLILASYSLLALLNV